MYEYLKKKKIADLVVVSPDVGGLKMAHAYSQVLEAGLAIVAKRRKSAKDVESMALIGEIRGKNVLMVDDLTETAGTLTSAADLLHRKALKRFMPAYPTPCSTTWAFNVCENRGLTNS